MNDEPPQHLQSACAAIQRVLTHRHPEHHWIVEPKRNEPANTPKTLTEQHPPRTPHNPGKEPMQIER